MNMLETILVLLLVISITINWFIYDRMKAYKAAYLKYKSSDFGNKLAIGAFFILSILSRLRNEE